jgi:hypothetical protein
MPVAHTVDLRSHPSLSPGTAERSGTALRAVLVAAIIAIAALALLGGAYAGLGGGDGYPDPTQQWTD